MRPAARAARSAGCPASGAALPASSKKPSATSASPAASAASASSIWWAPTVGPSWTSRSAAAKARATAPWARNAPTIGGTRSRRASWRSMASQISRTSQGSAARSADSDIRAARGNGGRNGFMASTSPRARSTGVACLPTKTPSGLVHARPTAYGFAPKPSG